MRRFLPITLLLLVACSAQPAPVPALLTGPTVAVRAQMLPLSSGESQCTGGFVPHGLPHTTSISGPPYEVFDGNGSGLALGDLDNDGRIDIVLGNLNGPNTILWNQGGMHFQPQSFGDGGVRAVSIVDLDGDQLRDIVVAQRYAKPVLWHNTANPDPQQRFVETTLPGVNNEAYALDWSDIEGDGDLDLITGSYDAELLDHQGLIFTQRGNGVGVFVYTQTNGQYEGTRLANQSDVLALAVPDLNRDGRRDLLVGNDFNRPDAAFLQTEQGWQAVQPFDRTTENTMSLALGDIQNNGTPEIFATDMKPYAKDTATMAEWLPAMKRLTKPLTADDPQYVENVLQQQQADGTWHNIGYDLMVDSSGWSWSGKFGDLDQDGFVDLYVVNGMLARGLFDHLPNQELVEQNMVFRNQQGQRFAPAAEWGLGHTASGRSMSMADLDGDGDLDIVVNNLNTPAVVFENRICAGQPLLVDLVWEGTQNRDAIGAQLQLESSVGRLTRDVTAVSGYLSGDAAQIHFGLPEGAVVGPLTVRWPDGAVSTLAAPQPGTRLVVTR